MTDAVASAAEVPLAVVRRAAMLSGDLGRTAALALTRAGRRSRRCAWPCCTRSRRCWPPAPTTWPRRSAKTGEASVEWKLDGARVQVHRQGDEVRIYTRNLNDITHRLPGVVALALALPAEAVVLDGEVARRGRRRPAAAPSRTR